MPPEMGASADVDPSDRCVRDCRQRSNIELQSSTGSRASAGGGGLKSGRLNQEDKELEQERLHRSRSSIGDEARLSKELAARRRRIGFWRHPIVTLR